VVGAREEGLDHLPEATDAGDSIEFGSLPDTLDLVPGWKHMMWRNHLVSFLQMATGVKHCFKFASY
jgi:hypothetical protein